MWFVTLLYFIARQNASQQQIPLHQFLSFEFKSRTSVKFFLYVVTSVKKILSVEIQIEQRETHNRILLTLNVRSASV